MREKRVSFVQAIAILLFFSTIVGFPSEGISENNSSNDGDKQQEDPCYREQLSAFREMTNLVYDNYVDPVSLNYSDMFMNVLKRISRVVPDLLVMFDSENKRMQFQIGRSKTFFLGEELSSNYQFQCTMANIVDHIAAYSDEETNWRTIELAAISGVIESLDPHSSYYDSEEFKQFGASTLSDLVGLGITFKLEDGKLIVVECVKGSPAHLAGVKDGDRILKINNESVKNHSINRIIKMLEGDRGERVKLTVSRKGHGRSLVFEIKRDLFRVQSVYYKELKDRIGYIHVTSFSAGTIKEFKSALRKVVYPDRGLILDLRGNGGGLVFSALQLCDLFFSRGEILSVAGSDNEILETYEARLVGTEERYPIIVLVDSNSASAAEILAGALKNRGRAIVVGDATFGKGSIQSILELEDESALRVTIARYLTPGGISIQGAGITPHISTIPVRFDKNQVHYFVNKDAIFERNLHGSLSASSVAREEPLDSIPYLYDDRRDSLWLRDKVGKINAKSYVVEFARKLLKSMPRKHRIKKQISLAIKMAEDENTKMSKKIAKAFKKRGVTWEENASGGGSPQVETTFRSKPSGPFQAGSSVKLIASVKNTGTGAYSRLRAVTSSENPDFDKLEFFFGNVPAGKRIEWTTVVNLGSLAETRSDDLVLTFFDDEGQTIEPLRTRIDVASLKKTSLACSWRISDEKGNGDGLVQKNEPLEFHILIKNKGIRPLKNGKVVLVPLENDEEISIGNSTKKIRLLKPKKTTSLKFNVKIGKEYKKNSATLRFYIVNHDNEGVFVGEYKVTPHNPMALSSTKGNKAVFLAKNTALFASPENEASVLTFLKQDEWLHVLGTKDTWLKVAMKDMGKIGWTKTPESHKLVKRSKTFKPAVDCFSQLPEIELFNPVHYTDSDTLRLEGMASHAEGITDVSVFVNGFKVYFLSESEQNLQKVPFVTDLTLREGSNEIQIVARGPRGLLGQKWLRIFRPTLVDSEGLQSSSP